MIRAHSRAGWGEDTCIFWFKRERKFCTERKKKKIPGLWWSSKLSQCIKVSTVVWERNRMERERIMWKRNERLWGVGLDTCECTKQKVMRFCAQLNPSTCKGTWRQKITLSPENSGISVTSKCGGREKEWLKQQCDMPMDTQLEKVASDWLFFCVCNFLVHRFFSVCQETLSTGTNSI